MFDLEVSSLCSCCPFHLSSSFLLSLQFLSKTIALLYHCSIEDGCHSDSMSFWCCYMQVHLSRNYIPTVISPPNYTSPPFLQHVLWQCCNHLGIPSSTAEILLFNSVFHYRVTSVSISTLKPPLRVIGAIPLKP